MKKLCVLLAVCVLSVGIVACGEPSPALTAPDGAYFDGGYTIGGGYKSDSTTVVISSTETTTGSDSTTTERGGHTAGSGN